MEKDLARNEVLLACDELARRGLVARTWGNVSCRVDEKRFVITPSGIGYERLTPELIVVVNMDTLEHEGAVKPSSEKGIHADAYKASPEMNFIIHTHQTYASCLSVAGFSDIKPTHDEESELGGGVALAEYGLPGSGRLRKNVVKALTAGHSAVLMEKHGALLTGKDRETAFRRAGILEEICRRSVAPLEFTGGDPEREADSLHAALLSKTPDAKALVSRNAKTFDAIIETEKKLPAILDDFAQMVGDRAKCVTSGDPARIIQGFKKNNCVLAKGLGAVCYARDESDAAALLTLMEKNALAFLHAKRYGRPQALSLLDRKLMRVIYLKKYSKKK
jgi:L-fuculose-phosphate aldolase